MLSAFASSGEDLWKAERQKEIRHHSNRCGRALSAAITLAAGGALALWFQEVITPDWLRRMAGPMLLLLAIAAFIRFCIHVVAERMARGWLEDFETVLTRQREDAALPAATMQWLTARARVWRKLTISGWWLGGELLFAVLCLGSDRFFPGTGYLCIALVFCAPFTVLDLVLRLAEFMSLSQKSVLTRVAWQPGL